MKVTSDDPTEQCICIGIIHYFYFDSLADHAMNPLSNPVLQMLLLVSQSRSQKACQKACQGLIEGTNMFESLGGVQSNEETSLTKYE